MFTTRVLASALLKVVLGSNWQSTSAQMHMHAKLPFLECDYSKIKSHKEFNNATAGV